MRLSVVIIGRNEGERLIRCIQSVNTMALEGGFEVIYVDSGSSDDSVERARELGARVYVVTHERPPAARGRNLGLSQAKAPFVLFLDGDTELHPEFASRALACMDEEPETAVVWGHRRETRPQDSIYNRVLDLDWIYPPGFVAFCGGDAIMRVDVLRRIDAFREDLVAGEEPEMCNRIRSQGFRIHHLNIPMTGHDLAIRNFKSYWLRCYRAGHAYAEVSRVTGGETFGRESKRNLIQGGVYMMVPFLFLLFGLPGLAVLCLGVLAVLARTTLRARWRGASLTTTFAYALHSHFCQIPIWFGQILYYRKREQQAGRIIEYK